MNIYEQFGSSGLIDEAKTFPLDENTSITMLPTGGEKAKRAFQRMMEPYAPRINAGGELSDEENRKLNVRFYSEYIVKGWTGIFDADGKEIVFSKEAAATLFNDKKLAKFFALIIRMSQNDEAFTTALSEGDEGNS